jgi:hypothetical protein
VIFGTWNTFELHLLNHDLETLHVEPVNVNVLLKSVALHQTGEVVTILIGLGDGYLVTYNLNGTNFLNRRMTLIGNYPVELSYLTKEDETNLFMLGDSPAVF